MRIGTLVWLTLAASFFSTSAAIAADRRVVDDLDAMAGGLLAESSMPAIAIAAGDSQGLLALGVAGKRRIHDTEPVARNDRFHLGSDTKAITATLAATFVQEGKLEWTSTLRELFPDVETMDRAYHDVTLAELLGHRSGLTSSIMRDHPEVWATMWKNAGPVEKQRRWFVETMLSRPPAFPPHESYEYSNAGFIVAGAALERIAGASWEQLMQKRIFAPLGMTSCGFGAPGSEESQTDDAPWGHRNRDAGPVAVVPGPQADNPPALGPAGTVHCSLPHWGLFIADQLAGLNGKGRLMKKTTYEQLHPPGAGYAMGWGVASRDWAGGEAWSHSGSNTMWYVTAWVAPALDRFYLAAANIARPSTSGELDRAIGLLIRKYAESNATGDDCR